MTTSRPSAMFPILIARSDDSAPDDRRERSEGSVIDRQGKPIERPDLTPSLNALEGNPNLMFEHWDEFWRKVHGPRVVHRDTAEDSMIEGVSNYHQIHRLAGAPSSAFPPPYEPLVDSTGLLYPHVWDKVPPYVRPAYDGLVYWAAPTTEALIPVGYSRQAVEKINHEGNLFNRGSAGSLSAEYVIVPTEEAALPPVCTVKIHHRRAGEQHELQERLLRWHSDVIKDGELARRLVRRFAYIFTINKSADEPFYSERGVEVDAISVTYFRNMGDCETYYGSDEYRAVAQQEAEFLDTERSEWWTGIVYPLIDVVSEAATDRDSRVPRS
ncbi:hypothetical protein [Streptomyces sp. NPDC059894]|uniref:hypothetical protein n=1 Tax=unclassified Streptomyces TaxID=2593676 RepID=UPI003649D8B0